MCLHIWIVAMFLSLSVTIPALIITNEYDPMPGQ